MTEFTHGDYVRDNTGAVWLITRDGGMAARATHTTKGIESAGIVWLENNRGPLRRLLDLEEVATLGAGDFLVLRMRQPSMDELAETLPAQLRGRVIIVDDSVAVETVQLNPHGMAADAIVNGFDELALFLGGSGDSWTGDALRLVAKSDLGHRAGLRAAFPVLVKAWETWVSRAPMTVAELTAACYG